MPKRGTGRRDTVKTKQAIMYAELDDPEAHRDEYRDRLAALIQAKAEGQTVSMPAAAAASRRSST